MKEHHHVFDSGAGYVNNQTATALMCSCSSWGMSGGGVWQAVPRELLPFACRALTKMHKAAGYLKACAIALAIGYVLAYWLVRF